MKILSVSVLNFASYESLTFEPSERGLTLVEGPTGSGKSTLCDVVPWVLFGRTAKGGAVDDVISWNATGPTVGAVYLDDNTMISRRRKPNDVFITKADGNPIRGKDLADTQRMINELIGMDFDLYLASSYYHEFSQTAQFFTAKAKDRRAIFEQLTDLSLAEKLTEETSNAKREMKAFKDELITEHKVSTAKYNELKRSHSNEITREGQWDSDKHTSITTTIVKLDSFETDRTKAINDLHKRKKNFEADIQAQMKELEEKIDTTKLLIKPTKDIQGQRAYIQGQIDHIKNDRCPTCGSAKGSDRVMLLTKDLYNLDKVENDNRVHKSAVANYLNQWSKLEKSVNPYTQQILTEEGRQNTYAEQLADLNKAKNPYTKNVESLNTQVYELGVDLLEIKEAIDSATESLGDLELLADVVSTYRASALKSTVKAIETTTNDLLVKHFDAEIKVQFEATDADKIDVAIAKDGNEATYTQLSKGQRCLLKLCFGISVMKQVALNHALTVNTLWFDEALDGLSDELKLKAFGVLESLAVDYGSVFCVEHNNALKSSFTNRITVRLNNGRSYCEEA